MPIAVEELIEPTTTALVTCEVQRGIVGDLAAVPDLAEEAAAVGLVHHAVSLVTAARAVGVRVVHVTVALRGDRAGASINNPMMAHVVKNPDQVRQGTPAADVIPELGPEPPDIVCARIHGLTPFAGTELDSILRNLGVRTIVPVGVSVNVALLGLCLSAADLGYRVVLPTDAIAGIPGSYTEDVVRHTLSLLARLTTSDEIARAWNGERAS